jgi:hypothetical protein
MCNTIIRYLFSSNTSLNERTSNLGSEITLLSVSFTLLQAEYLQGKNPWYPREQWDPYDPMLLSEGAFAAGMIFRSVNEECKHTLASVVVSVFPVLKFYKH